MTFSAEVLNIDYEAEASRIGAFMRENIAGILRRKGAVVAVSGGIDSSTTAALCVRALGRERVFALLMPERDSSGASTQFGKLLVEHLGIEHTIVDLSPILEAMGCYRYRDDAIRELFPDYTPAYKNKIILGDGSTRGARINYYSVVVESPGGEQRTQRLPIKNYWQIVAATNMKQRTRKSLEYFHADRLNYAVAGTPNLLEYDQGFFVKLGDGAADIKPIAHLYKTQVYAMAKHLGLPAELCARKPTTDTYSLEQSQEEFYFELPYPQLDLVLYGLAHGVEPRAIAAAVDLTEEQLQWIIKDVQQKRVTTEPLHRPPILLSPSH